MRDYSDKDSLFDGVSSEWRAFLDNDLLDGVVDQLGDEGTAIVPLANQVFEFARLTPLNRIKVIVVGQDPYPKAGYAHGLAFSCLVGVPGSLRNIYKCLKKTGLIGTIPTRGDLTYWATQGVLLLNCSLTTLVGKPNAHKNIWNEYTDDLLTRLSNHTCTFKMLTTGEVNSTRSPIFMLWGNFAKKKAELLNRKCLLVMWNHPSPLAQGRYPFIKCDNFTKVNAKLKLIGTIDWNQTNDVHDNVSDRFALDDRSTIVFTDGRAAPTRRCPEAIAGYAAVFALGLFKDVSIYGNIENRPHYASNQRSEGRAIFEVHKYLLNRIAEWDTCIIVTDSEFWIKMYTVYMPGWDAKDMSFKEKKNPDMTIPMYNLYKKLVFEFDKVLEFRHVRSHDKDGWSKLAPDRYEYFCWFNNDYVDQLAGYARKSLTPGTHNVDEIEYEDEDE